MSKNYFCMRCNKFVPDEETEEISVPISSTQDSIQLKVHTKCNDVILPALELPITAAIKAFRKAPDNIKRLMLEHYGRTKLNTRYKEDDDAREDQTETQ